MFVCDENEPHGKNENDPRRKRMASSEQIWLPHAVAVGWTVYLGAWIHFGAGFSFQYGLAPSNSMSSNIRRHLEFGITDGDGSFEVGRPRLVPGTTSSDGDCGPCFGEADSGSGSLSISRGRVRACSIFTRAFFSSRLSRGMSFSRGSICFFSFAGSFFRWPLPRFSTRCLDFGVSAVRLAVFAAWRFSSFDALILW